MATLHNSISLNAFPWEESERISAFRETEAFKQLDAKAKAYLNSVSACFYKSLERLTGSGEVVVLNAGEFFYRGVIHRGWGYVGIYTSVLSLLWHEFPTRREAMAAAMRNCGRINRYVAKTREELFPEQSRDYALEKSCRLVDGWYVDVVIGRDRLPTLLSAAVRASSLEWGKDVIVRMRTVEFVITNE